MALDSKAWNNFSEFQEFGKFVWKFSTVNQDDYFGKRKGGLLLYSTGCAERTQTRASILSSILVSAFPRHFQGLPTFLAWLGKGYASGEWTERPIDLRQKWVGRQKPGGEGGSAKGRRLKVQFRNGLIWELKKKSISMTCSFSL